jgi:PST family polysaccharide transporter
VVIALFYSTKSVYGEPLDLSWHDLRGNVADGLIILARASKYYLDRNCLHRRQRHLSWVCLNSFGLNGAGIAFSAVRSRTHDLSVVRRLSGFRWSSANRKTGLLCLTLVALVFCGFYILSPLFAVGLGILAVILISAYSIRILFNLVPSDRIPYPLRRWLARFGLTTSGLSIAIHLSRFYYKSVLMTTSQSI